MHTKYGSNRFSMDIGKELATGESIQNIRLRQSDSISVL